jgi:hypothetical protein
LVADTRRGWIADRRHRLAGLDQSLREPVVAGLGAEEVAGAHHQYRKAAVLQPALHLHSDRAFAGDGALRRILVNMRQLVRAIVVDGPRQQDARA